MCRCGEVTGTVIPHTGSIRVGVSSWGSDFIGVIYPYPL
jgi:hypothetical protein